MLLIFQNHGSLRLTKSACLLSPSFLLSFPSPSYFLSSFSFTQNVLNVLKLERVNAIWRSILKVSGFEGLRASSGQIKRAKLESRTWRVLFLCVF